MKTVSLKDMMKSKIEPFLDRKEICDDHDIEFMLIRGIVLEADNADILEKLLTAIKKLGKKDFSVKLGSLLNAPRRKYYRENGFRILELALRNQHM
ncbi:MAG: hypothetical protein GX874_06575 [Smithella sp.]|nr:hypothetical protein [Smithella sp.]